MRESDPTVMLGMVVLILVAVLLLGAAVVVWLLAT